MRMFIHHFHPLAALGGFTFLIIALVVWSLVWKGVGLWFSARNSQKAWFIAILILNTAGILEIIYLLFFRRDKRETTKSLFDAPAASASVAPTPEA